MQCFESDGHNLVSQLKAFLSLYQIFRFAIRISTILDSLLLHKPCNSSFHLQNLSNKIPKLLDQDLRRFSSIERAFDQIEKRSSIAPCRRKVVAVEEKNSGIITFNSEMDWV
ncbi:hypothetical protein SDJN03_18845, partial [Cucurbita argyrosperma subsp. sororia]